MTCSHFSIHSGFRVSSSIGSVHQSMLNIAQMTENTDNHKLISQTLCRKDKQQMTMLLPWHFFIYNECRILGV